MSYADQVFISMCEDILENGTSMRESPSALADGESPIRSNSLVL